MNASELAAAAGHFGWLERRLFEVMGGWVPTVPEPEVKLVLRSQSFQHAWHAELWQRFGPPRPARPAPRTSEFLDAVEQPEQTVERLAGVYEVLLPALNGCYRALADRAAAASDGPVVRCVGLMLADDGAALATGLRLLDGLDGEADQRARLDALLNKIGGIGPPECIE